jgi:hypothetical protein
MQLQEARGSTRRTGGDIYGYADGLRYGPFQLPGAYYMAFLGEVEKSKSIQEACDAEKHTAGVENSDSQHGKCPGAPARPEDPAHADHARGRGGYARTAGALLGKHGFFYWTLASKEVR